MLSSLQTCYFSFRELFSVWNNFVLYFILLSTVPYTCHISPEEQSAYGHMRDFLWEMDNIIMEPKKSQVRCLQDGESKKPWLLSSPSLEAYESGALACKSKRRCWRNSQRGSELCPSPHCLGPEMDDIYPLWCEQLSFAQPPHSNTHLREHFTDTSRVFYQLSVCPRAQSSWHLKLIITPSKRQTLHAWHRTCTQWILSSHQELQKRRVEVATVCTASLKMVNSLLNQRRVAKSLGTGYLLHAGKAQM